MGGSSGNAFAFTSPEHGKPDPEYKKGQGAAEPHHVRGLNDEDVDFSMDTSPFVEDTESWRNVCLSTTMLIFHGAVLATVIIVMVFSLVLVG